VPGGRREKAETIPSLCHGLDINLDLQGSLRLAYTQLKLPSRPQKFHRAIFLMTEASSFYIKKNNNQLPNTGSHQLGSTRVWSPTICTNE
jgi:hypothetical protein